MNGLKTYFQKDLWSPYVAGVLLGIVGVLAVWLSDSLLGASGAFENLAGIVGKAAVPQLFDNMYFTRLLYFDVKGVNLADNHPLIRLVKVYAIADTHASALG